MHDERRKKQRSDMERDALMSFDDGYDMPYMEDEAYGFAEIEPVSDNNLQVMIRAQPNLMRSLNLVYKDSKRDYLLCDLSHTSEFYRVIKRHHKIGDYIKTTFEKDGKIITGYVYHELFTVLLSNVDNSSETNYQYDTGVVSKNGGQLLKKPNGSEITKLPFNTSVYVFSVEEKWAHVQAGENRGYIHVDHLSTKTPKPGSEANLYLIKKGQQAQQLVMEEFDLSDEDDRRYYVNVLLYLNNPSNLNSRGIYVEDEVDVMEFLTVDQDRIKLREGKVIWIPSKTYADSLIDKVNSGSYKKEFKKKVDELTEGMRETIDSLWPVGFGAYYGASVGITFGLPAVDAQIETYFYRKNEKTLGLKKYDKVAAGIEAGFSAGFYIGKKNTKKGDQVLGRHTGMNAEAKAGLLSYAEYEFPINDGDAVLSALMAITNQSSMPVTKAVVNFLDIIADSQFSPEHYLKKSKLALNIGAQGTLNASLGAKKASADKSKETYTEKGTFASEKAADNYSSSLWDAVNPYDEHQSMMDYARSQMNVGADALLAANIKVGVEFEHEREMIDGKATIKSTEMAMFIEAGAQGQGNISIPFLINLGMGVDRSIGVKLLWKKNHGKDKSFQFQSVNIYTASGEMDYYAGGASETEVKLGDSIGESVRNIQNLNASSFKSLLKQVKYKKRIELANFLQKIKPKDPSKRADAAIIVDRQQGKQSAGKIGASSNYWQIEAYLDVEIDFGKAADRAINKIIQLISNSIKGETASEKFINGLQVIFDFIEGKETALITKVNESGIEETYNTIIDLFSKDMLPLAILHVRAGLGLAGGFQISGGAKAKLYGDISGGILVEYNVRDQLVNQINNMEEFITTYAKNKLSTANQGQLEEYVIEQTNF